MESWWIAVAVEARGGLTARRRCGASVKLRTRRLPALLIVQVLIVIQVLDLDLRQGFLREGTRGGSCKVQCYVLRDRGVSEPALYLRYLMKSSENQSSILDK